MKGLEQSIETRCNNKAKSHRSGGILLLKEEGIKMGPDTASNQKERNSVCPENRDRNGVPTPREIKRIESTNYFLGWLVE